MLLLLLAQGIFSGWLFRESRDLGESVKQKELPLVLEAMQLREGLLQIQGELHGWILTQEASYQSAYQRLWSELLQKKILSENSLLRQQVVRLQVLQDEVFELAHTLESLPASRLMKEVLQGQAEEIQDATRRILFLERRRSPGSQDPRQIQQSKFLLYTLSTFQRSFSEVLALLNSVLLTGESDALARFTHHWRENEGAWMILNRSALTQQQSQERSRIAAVREQFLLNATRVIRLRGSEKWNLAGWKMKHEVIPLQQQLVDSVTALIEQRTTLLNQGFTHQSQVMNDGARMVWLFLAVALLVMAVAARAVEQGIRRPIRKVQQVFQDIHDKNYHTPIEAQSDDEMGMLLRSLQGMRQQLLDAALEEQASKAALQNQKFALDQSAIVSATDLDGRINYVNHKMLELSGYPEEALLGQNHRMIKSGLHDDAFYHNMWQTIRAGLVWRGEVCNKIRDGRLVWMDTTIVPFLGEDLLPIQYMAIRYDITLIKESEQRIREEQARTIETNNELQRSMWELQETQQQLVESEKMASLGGLVAGVAHEVNTPLGIGVTAASFLKDQTEQIAARYRSQQMKRSDLERYMEQAQESSGIVLENLMRASELVKSFKQVAVDQSNEVSRSFQVVPYLEDVVRSLRPTLKKLPHQVEISGDEQIAMVSTPGSFAQVVTNLVMNAVVHGLDDAVAGHIRMAVSREGERVVIRFEDDGKGAPAEVVEQIFEPFFTTRRGSGGSGLGMHLVYNLVTQQMGGEISCHSVEGEGMSFILRFPQEIAGG
jgi:PAS domain S-box-containing protein